MNELIERTKKLVGPTFTEFTMPIGAKIPHPYDTRVIANEPDGGRKAEILFSEFLQPGTPPRVTIIYDGV